MKRSESFKEFPKAFAAFQMEVTNPKMIASNPHANSKYAPLSEVFNAVRPIMAKHGLSFIQDVSRGDDHVSITTIIFHESGEWQESSPLTIPAGKQFKDGTVKVDAQTIGGAITYGKRYQFQAVIGVSADEDDDGATNAYDDQPKHVPTNLISSPNEATLKAKYQIVMGSIEGYEDYIKKMRDKGHDDRNIALALDKAKGKKEQEQEQKPA